MATKRTEQARLSPVALSLVTVVAAMVSIQTGASLAKRLFPVVGAPGTTALRLFLAALLLGLLWRPWRGRLTRRELLAVVTYGASLGAMNLLFYLALERIPLGIAGPIGVAHAGSALLDWSILPFALGVAVLSSALPYSLEMIALKHLPTRTFGILMSVEPAGRAQGRGEQSSRFAPVRVQTAERHVQRAPPSEELWLLIEWPEEEKAATKYCLSSLPANPPPQEAGATGEAALAGGARFPGAQGRGGTRPLRRPDMARLSPSRHCPLCLQHVGARAPPRWPSRI